MSRSIGLVAYGNIVPVRIEVLINLDLDLACLMAVSCMVVELMLWEWAALKQSGALTKKVFLIWKDNVKQPMRSATITFSPVTDFAFYSNYYE